MSTGVIHSALFSNGETIEPYTLTPFQFSCSEVLRTFKEEALNPLTLLGLTVGGGLARTVEFSCFKYLSSLSSVSSSRFSLFVPKFASLAGVVTEGGLFSGLPMLQERGTLSQWSIGTAHGSLVIGLSRVISRYAHNSFLISCLAQDCVVMGVDISFEKLELLEHQNIGLGERWVHARAVTFQMQVSSEICHFIPGLINHKAMFELQKGSRESAFIHHLSLKEGGSRLLDFVAEEIVTPEGILFCKNEFEKRAFESPERFAHLFFSISEGDKKSQSIKVDSTKQSLDAKKLAEIKSEISDKCEENRSALQALTDELARVAKASYSFELAQAYAQRKIDKSDKVKFSRIEQGKKEVLRAQWEKNEQEWKQLRKVWEFSQAEKIKSGTPEEKELAAVALVGSVVNFIYKKTKAIFSSAFFTTDKAQALREEFIFTVIETLFKYIHKFDPARSSYPTYTRGAIDIIYKRFVSKIRLDVPIHVPTQSEHSHIRRILLKREELALEIKRKEKTSREPTTAEIAQALKSNHSKVARTLALVSGDNRFSLDARGKLQKNSKDRLGHDLISEKDYDDEMKDPESSLIKEDYKRKLSRVFRNFSQTLRTPLEHAVFSKRLLTDHRLTQEEVGVLCGVSQERVRQVEQKILGRLKKYMLKYKTHFPL